LRTNFLFKNQKKDEFFSDFLKIISKPDSCITGLFTQTSEPRNQTSEPESLTSEPESHSSSSLFRRWKWLVLGSIFEKGRVRKRVSRLRKKFSCPRKWFSHLK